MTTFSIVMKLVAWLSIRDNVTENQIRGYLADSQTNLTARIQTLVDNAPPAAQAVLDQVTFRLKVNSVGVGEWEIYPKMILDVTVADTITLQQVLSYLEDYWDQAKTDLRALVAGAPAGANAQLTSWHIHRLSGSVDEAEG